MGDILPPKKQAIVERLRRRIEDYRHHHGACLPRYELATNGLYDQHKQGTLLLQQRYLEPKAKKANKKNDHKKDASNNNNNNLQNSLAQQKLLKRPAESPLNSGGEPNFDDVDHPSKLARTCNSSNPNLTQFSVEIVQQFTSTGSSQAQQIQTNVTVKALSGNNNVKSDGSSLGGGNQNAGGANGNGGQKLSERSPSSVVGLGQVECKQEPELELDGCVLNSGDATNNGAPSLSDSLSNFGFMEDSSDEIIHPDTLKDLIAELTPDIMSEFNFDKFDDTSDSVKNQDDSDKDISPGSILDMGKSMTSLSNQNSLQGNPQTPQYSSPNPSSSPLFDPGPQGGSGNINNLPNMPPVTSSVVSSQSSRLPNYPSLGSGLSLDFNLKEPSPAAQTLKQMAEQHQNMQQKQQQLGLGMNSPHSRSPFGSEFGLPSPSQYGGNSGAAEFLNSPTNNNPGFMTSKSSNPGMFSFAQNNLGTGMGAGSMMKQEPSSMFGNSQNSLSEMEMRKRQQQVMQMQRLSTVDQKPSLVPPVGSPGSAGTLASNTSSVQSQSLGFGSTKPLSHFTEPGLSVPGPSPTNQTSSLQQLQSQFIRGPNSNTQYNAPPRPQSGPSLQISQSQQLQISQNNQQLQMSQGQHIQMQEMVPVSQSQQQAMYGGFHQSSPNDQFHLSVSQSQSVNFSSGQPPASPYAGRDLGSTGPGNAGATPPFDKMDPMLRQKLMQQHIMRQQMMEQKKLAQLQQQQQQQQQQQRQQQQQPMSSSFLPRPPPPEYKPQQQPSNGNNPGSLPSLGPNANSMLSAMNQNHVFNQNGGAVMRGMSPGAGGSGPLSQMTMAQSRLMTPQMQQGQMVGPQGVMTRFASVQGLQGSGVRVGGGGSSGGLPGSKSVTAPTYSSALMRGQRPPNVNVGPEGLNISQRGLSGQDWRQMLLQNQVKFTGPGPSVRNPMGVQGRPPSFSQSVPAGAAGFNSMQAAAAGGMQMSALQQQQVRLAMAGMGPRNPGPGQGGPQQPGRSMGMQLPSLERPMGPTATQGSSGGSVVNMQMNSSVSMASTSPMTSTGAGGVQTQSSFMGGGGGGGNTTPTSAADFNLDFLDSIPGTGMDGSGGGGFSSSDATDLLNTFNSASYMLDGGL